MEVESLEYCTKPGALGRLLGAVAAGAIRLAELESSFGARLEAFFRMGAGPAVPLR